MRQLTQFCAMSILLCSCAPSAVHVGVRTPAPAAVVVVNDPGPSLWVVAHGDRRHGYHRYRYYEHSQVYYDIDRSVYFYLDVTDGSWRTQASLPSYVVIQQDNVVELDMTSELPYHHHSEIVQKYPPGQLKKHHKEKKGKGHGRGKDRD